MYNSPNFFINIIYQMFQQLKDPFSSYSALRHKITCNYKLCGVNLGSLHTLRWWVVTKLKRNRFSAKNTIFFLHSLQKILQNKKNKSGRFKFGVTAFWPHTLAQCGFCLTSRNTVWCLCYRISCSKNTIIARGQVRVSGDHISFVTWQQVAMYMYVHMQEYTPLRYMYMRKFE